MYRSIRKFIYKFITIIVLFVALAITVVSIISYNKNDPGFGKFENTDQINNYLGSLGANISSFSFEFIGFGSYLIPLFLLFQIIKVIKFDRAYLLIFRFLLFFIGLSFSGVFLHHLKLNAGILGDISYALFLSFQKTILGNSYLFTIVLVGIYILGIFFIYLSLALPVTYLKKLRIIFFPFVVVFSLVLKRIKSEKKEMKNYPDVHYKQKGSSKVEPVINKDKRIHSIQNSKINKSYNQDNLSYTLPEINL